MQFLDPTKKEIQDWLETKETMFAEKENRNPRLSIEAWLDKYIFIDEHEIFFASLPSELHEWLSKLAETSVICEVTSLRSGLLKQFKY